jgi:hypothetical protein
MAHTPGPWRIEMQGNYMKLYMPGPLKGDVARGYIGKDNANLLAAAPEMLEALELISTAKQRGFGIDYAEGCARQVLHKIKGGGE